MLARTPTDPEGRGVRLLTKPSFVGREVSPFPTNRHVKTLGCHLLSLPVIIETAAHFQFSLGVDAACAQVGAGPGTSANNAARSA